MERKTQISFFMSERDEVAIAEAVVLALPEVRLVDDWSWEAVDCPPIRDSPLDCKRAIGIWHSGIMPKLAGVARANGTIDAPSGGPVVQWLRCRRVNDDLQHGRWAAIYDSENQEVVKYVRALWRVLRNETTDRLKRTSAVNGPDFPSERRFRVGWDAFESAKRGEFALKADALTLAPE